MFASMILFLAVPNRLIPFFLTDNDLILINKKNKPYEMALLLQRGYTENYFAFLLLVFTGIRNIPWKIYS
jgi:hypothetical protein